MAVEEMSDQFLEEELERWKTLRLSAQLLVGRAVLEFGHDTASRYTELLYERERRKAAPEPSSVPGGAPSEGHGSG